MNTYRMPLEEWIKVLMYLVLGCLAPVAERAAAARPRFDTSTDMGLVLVPADAEIDSVIFRLRATDQDADFPLIFDITATVTPVVRIENLPCTLYNKVCQANVILTRRLTPGRLHDFAVRVKDSKGDSNSMQATISVTNATTQRDKIFPHIPAIIMVPEDTKPGKELDYVLVRSNQWSGKPVYIELWQPKELFTIRQRQTPAETRGVITLIGELDFETQSMYTLTIYATDPYTEPKKDTRNIAGLHLVVVVQDVQDVPPIFTIAPPLTKINNTVKPGDIILRVHAEDGDKGVPREVTYGLVSEGNPFTPFFNITETTGEIILARPLEELTQITHVGAPVVLTVVAEEIRRSTMEPPAQATVVEVGLLLGEPGNSPPFFENDNYVAWMDENAEPGSVVTFTEHYSTKVRDEDIGKAGVFALKLDNNNGTFEISPAVAERTANFIITVRDNSLMDYEIHKSLRFKIIAQEVGPATNLSATVPATIFLRDVNDNAPEFEVPSYEVTLSENATAGTRVTQVHATDRDTGSFGRIQYTRVIGTGSEAFDIDPYTGIITVGMETSALDREVTSSLRLSVEARDEDGKGLRGTVPLIVNLLDVNDNAPIFEMTSYKFTLNEDLTNFTTMAMIKAFDADAEPPNNEIRYEIIHGNYENKFYLDEITGELFLREPINKVRRTRHNNYQNFATMFRNGLVKVQKTFEVMLPSSSTIRPDVTRSPETTTGKSAKNETSDSEDNPKTRIKRADKEEVLFTLTARAYDLGVPHLSGVTEVSVLKGPVAGARIVRFVVSGENPDPVKTADTLATITGGRINVLAIHPYTSTDIPSETSMNVPSLETGKKSIVVARVEPNGDRTSLVDIEKIRTVLAANGVGVIDGDMPAVTVKPVTTNHNTNTNINSSISVISEEVTVYKAENRLLFWLLIILGLLMLIALIALIICCICPGCPFYMAPRKRRVHSSETLIARSDGRPRRHLHRKHARMSNASWSGRKQAWSADPMRRNWQFNRRNQKAGGLASLPGDVRVVDRDDEIAEKGGSLRLRDGAVPMYFTEPTRRPDEERIYMEDVEGLRGQGYDLVNMESLAQRDVERSSEMARRAYANEEEQRTHEHAKFVREQHFYRDGNAEVLRLVTRGQVEEGAVGYPTHRSLVIDQAHHGAYRVDGKDILLQRFIEDQKIRHSAEVGHDLHDSLQDIERRSMESHHRQKEAIGIQQQQQQQQQHQQQQQLQQHQQHTQVLLIPERLEEDHRQHIEELGPEVQRLIIDHGTFENTGRFESKESQEVVPAATLLVHAPITIPLGEKIKEHVSKQSVNVQQYSIQDLELARQNALLTRLLLERDSREVGAGAMVDSASYLETQSLPGQVAIATQTDRTAATQTELPSRSRSDNDESEEEARMRRKMKSKKRHGDGEPRRIRTLWMKSPIQEEDSQYCTEKRTNVLRKKIKDVKESRRISLEPEVLQAISDSLDENGETPITARRRDPRRDDSNSREESRNDEDNGRVEDSSSTDFGLTDGRRIIAEKRDDRSVTDEEFKRKGHRGKNTVEPSFRILEREMSSLSKKLSKLAGKKMLQYSNGSETDSHDQTKTVTTDLKKIEKKLETQVADGKIVSKGVEAIKSKRSKSTPRTTPSEGVQAKEQTKIREEVVGESKARHSSKYRKIQTISTGSSDFEESAERIKKQMPMVTHAEKQKQMVTKASHMKLKRQNKVEHKEPTKTALLALAQDSTEQKDNSDSASKGSVKSGKSERDSMRMKKYSSGTSGGKTVSGSPSSDYSKDTKVRRVGRPVLDAGKKTSAGTSETSSGKVSQEETTMPVKSHEKRSVESTVTDTKEKSPEAPELRIKISTGGVEMQKSAKIIKPVLSPEVPESRMKIIPEAVEIQKSEKISSPVLSPEVPDLTMNIARKDLEIRKSERILTPVLSPEVPELRTKVTPEEVEIQKSDKTLTPILSPEVPELVLKITPEGEEMQKSGKTLTPSLSPDLPQLTKSDPQIVEIEKNEQALTPTLSPEVAELSIKISPEDMETQKSGKIVTPSMSPEMPELIKIGPQVVETQKIEKALTPTLNPELPESRINIVPETAVSKTSQTPIPSPEVPILSTEIISKTADTHKGETLQILEHEKGTAEASEKKTPSAKTNDDKESEEPSEPIENQALTMPKEMLVDFLSHEMKDSTQSLQGHQPSLTGAVEKIKDIVLASASMENEGKEATDDRQKEESSEPIKLEKSDHFEEWEEVPADTRSDMEHKIQDRPVVVSQESEDAAMFSDNFDSFCGTDMHQKDSLETRVTEGEISYETLESESSEDRLTDDKSSHAKHTDEKDHAPKTTEESEEATAPQIATISREEETEKSEQLPPETIPKSRSDREPDSPKRPTSRTPTPIPLESGTERAEVKISSPDVIDELVPKLETDTLIPIQEPSDIPKHKTEPEFPKVEELSSSSSEAHIEVPKVPPLDAITSDKKMTTPKEEPSKSKLTEIEVRVASPSPPSPEEIKLETLSQKEFGIADSLFVDAKLLKVSPRTEKKTAVDTDVKELRDEKLNDIQRPVNIEVPAVNLEELSRAMLDDGDDSDSSEASSKTMLTARPYGTPRHRPVSSGTVDASEASESKSTDSKTTKDVSVKISLVSPKTGESIESTEKFDAKAVADKPDESTPQTSPAIETETTPSASEKIDEEINVSVQDPSPVVLPAVTSGQAAGETVEARGEREPKTSSQISEGETKVSDSTASPEEIPTTEASDKVQLNQIAQEKLPAVADGFASLPEMDEPLKSADVSKVTEEAASSPMEMRRGAVIAKIVKAPGNGTKHAPSMGRETKRAAKKKEPSREDVPKGTRKTTTLPMKISSPKREIKTKALKEGSSKIGKQSIVSEQFARSRDTKRQAGPVEPQVGEQTDAPSRSDRNRRTWRKTDRPQKDVPQQDKDKVEKVKKSSSGGNTETITTKQPTETRAKDERPKDSGVKKVHEKAGKADKSKRSISEAKVEQTLKSEPVKETEDQQIVKKSADQHSKEDEERTIDSCKKEEMESMTIGKTKGSVVPSPVSSYPKTNEEDMEMKDMEENKLSDESTKPLVEMVSMLDNVVDKTVETELPEDSENDSREKESMTSEEVVKSESVREPEKVHEMPVADEQNVEAGEVESVSEDRGILSEGTDDQAQVETETVDNAEEESAEVSDSPEKSSGIRTGKATSQRKSTKLRRETEIVVIESQSRYMEWYKQKREEMERKRRERKDTDEEEERPKWLRKSTRQRWFRSGPDDKRMFDPKIGETTPGRRKKIKPLVNVESEQLKAIVRQGRKLRKAQGEMDDEPQIIIFAPEKPPTPRSSIPVDSRYHHHHHLVQHSEYSYEKMPVAPFYLHTPPVQNPSPQNIESLGPEQFQSRPTDPTCPDEGFHSGIIVQQPQAGGKLRHQQILEKKSVFDIAYSEAAPSHLRADSTTPPS